MSQVARRNFLKFAAAGTAGAALVPAVGAAQASAGTVIALQGRRVRLEWRPTADGWALATVQLLRGNEGRSVLTPSGRYGIWSASAPPSVSAGQRVQAGTHSDFLPQQATSSNGTATFTSTQAAARSRDRIDVARIFEVEIYDQVR